MLKLLPFIALTAAAFVITPAIHAGPGEEAAQKRREITATGTSQATLHPDRAKLQFSVESRDAELKVAKADNDRRTAAIFELAKFNGLAQDEISANYTGVEPRYRKKEDGRETLIGYTVNRKITLRLHDLTRYEELLGGLFQAGITTLDKIEYTSSRTAEFEDKILVEATREARRKAELMVAALGAKLGKVLVMQPGTGLSGQYIIGGVNVTNSGYGSIGAYDAFRGNSSPESPGVIELTQSVTITFEIE